jgi:hypothetical protein
MGQLKGRHMQRYVSSHLADVIANEIDNAGGGGDV